MQTVLTQRTCTRELASRRRRLFFFFSAWGLHRAAALRKRSAAEAARNLFWAHVQPRLLRACIAAVRLVLNLLASLVQEFKNRRKRALDAAALFALPHFFALAVAECPPPSLFCLLSWYKISKTDTEEALAATAASADSTRSCGRAQIFYDFFFRSCCCVCEEHALLRSRCCRCVGARVWRR